MIRNHKTFIATLTVVGLTALSLMMGSSAAFASIITYKGVTFETQGSGTAATDSNGDLLLTPSSNSFALHTNRIPDNGNGPSTINQNNTPYISFSYMDTGTDGQRITGNINDEAAGVYVGGGSRNSSAKFVKLSAQGSDSFPFDEGARSPASHTVLLGKTADNTLYSIFDGEQRSSDFFKNSGISFDFNDFYLRANSAMGETIHFTDLAYGDDFSPSAQPVPEPSNLLLLGLGLGMVGMLIRRRHSLS